MSALSLLTERCASLRGIRYLGLDAYSKMPNLIERNRIYLRGVLAFVRSLLLGQDTGSSLRFRAVHSGAWIGAGFVAQKALQLGSNLVLTRLLFPEAFGLMALATVFLVGLAMFSDIGLKPAVIRDPRGDDPKFLNTAWTIQAGRGIALCAIGAAIAYPVSLIYGEPILFPLLAVLSTTAAINGFTSISTATAERRLDFRVTTIVQLLGQASSIVLLVIFAYVWRSVWALAAANVASSIVTVVIGYVFLPAHTHRIEIDDDSTRSLFKFGRWILFSTLATYLGGEGLRAVQGALLTPGEFGVLAIAYTIASIPNDLSMKLVASIGLPALAETHRISPQNSFAVLRSLRLRALIISLSLSSVVIIGGEPIIKLMYDDRYHSAGQYLVALSLSNAVGSINTGYSSAILALGEARSYFFLMVVIAISRIIGVLSGYHLDGLMGMLFGIGAANAFTTPLCWSICFRMKLIDAKLDIVAYVFVVSTFVVHMMLNLFL